MASTGLQDFTSYTEVDASSHLTVTATKALGVNVGRDEDVYLYKDFGANFFNSTTATFELYVASTSVYSGASPLGGIALTVSAVDDISGHATTDINALIAKESSDYKIFLERGPGTATDHYVCSADTIYYCLLERVTDSDTVTLKIYSDSTRTTLVDTLTVNGYGTSTKWRYVYGFVSWNFPVANAEFDGYVSNLRVYEADAGYAATYPVNQLLRASGIVRTFWAGVGGQSVYQTVITMGGLSTAYVPPIGEREPVSAITPAGERNDILNYQAWLRQVSLPTVIRIFGHVPTLDRKSVV